MYQNVLDGSLGLLIDVSVIQIFLVSEGLFICSIYTSKLAVLLATERLLASNMNMVRKICIAIRVIIGLAAVASVLSFSIGCSLGSLLLPENQHSCAGQVGCVT
jgi:hypothetical protein